MAWLTKTGKLLFICQEIFHTNNCKEHHKKKSMESCPCNHEVYQYYILACYMHLLLKFDKWRLFVCLCFHQSLPRLIYNIFWSDLCIVLQVWCACKDNNQWKCAQCPWEIQLLLKVFLWSHEWWIILFRPWLQNKFLWSRAGMCQLFHWRSTFRFLEVVGGRINFYGMTLYLFFYKSGLDGHSTDIEFLFLIFCFQLPTTCWRQAYWKTVKYSTWELWCLTFQSNIIYSCIHFLHLFQSWVH